MAGAFNTAAFNNQAFNCNPFTQTPVRNHTAYRSVHVKQLQKPRPRPQTRKSMYGFALLFAIGALLWS
jgi:hypothetical protein